MTAPLNILIAYPYFKQQMIDEMLSYDKSNYRLIVDSGAFTAWNIGKTIDMDEYCRFLDSISFLRPFKAVQLDVFGDPEKTYQNFLIMQKRGYDVMPVFTRGDSLERLEEFYSYTDYIMFGGIVIGGANKNYVKWFCETNKGRKAHWLGFVNMPFIKKYRPESVDSSSWLNGARFGSISYYRGQGEMTTINRNEYLEHRNKIEPCLYRSGVLMHQIANLSNASAWVDGDPGGDFSYGPNSFKGLTKFVSACCHIQRAMEVEKHLQTKIYLAISTILHLKTAYGAYCQVKERLWKNKV